MKNLKEFSENRKFGQTTEKNSVDRIEAWTKKILLMGLKPRLKIFSMRLKTEYRARTSLAFRGLNSCS